MPDPFFCRVQYVSQTVVTPDLKQLLNFIGLTQKVLKAGAHMLRFLGPQSIFPLEVLFSGKYCELHLALICQTEVAESHFFEVLFHVHEV